MTVLITGATGFVGSFLSRKLLECGLEVISSVRSSRGLESDVVISHVDERTNWDKALDNIDIVIHCAARVHVMKDEIVDSLAQYRSVNREGTLNLARQAAAKGVKRFIFISTIKVNGESTENSNRFTPKVKCIPIDAYALSKYEAEIGLKSIAKETDLEVVIVRPPLVYGPNVKANFAVMLKLAGSGLPLPFGCITQNRRSLVSIDNLVDFIITCINHPAAANDTFLVSDNEDLSTADMSRRLARACGRSGLLFPVPKMIFKVLLKIGKPDLYKRLCGSLQVDISYTIKKLDWSPPYTVDESFTKMAQCYLIKK